jgi:hypothetical protein
LFSAEGYIAARILTAAFLLLTFYLQGSFLKNYNLLLLTFDPKKRIK